MMCLFRSSLCQSTNFLNAPS